ncbi:MAG: argininosuccinate synthase [Candidatus Micrarchaeota archaeon]|nr:argininosuccinate synthase [Candidatus Micrarchaeota archaeon]
MDELARQIRVKMGKEYDGLDAVALAYSGGLDSDVIGAILTEWGIKVHPVVFEMGGHADTRAIVKKAEARFGSAHLIDITEPVVRAAERGVMTNCLQTGHLNSGAFSRPFMARGLADVARRVGVGAVAHGASGTGNDHLRMDLALRTLSPELRVLAPVRDWDLRRDDELLFAARRKWPLPAQTKLFSVDENVWGRSIRQGMLVDPQAPIPPGACAWTAEVEDAPDEPAEAEIEFKRGIAIQVAIANAKGKSGKRSAPLKVGREKLMEKLNEIGGAHGIGRADVIVDKVVGLKMREVHESPAAAILCAAHADLERLCLTSAELEVKSAVDMLWNRCVYDGGWHSRLRRDLDAFVDQTQAAVDGIVRVKLYKGGIHITGRTSPRGLYDHRLGRRDRQGLLSQSSVRAFSRLYGLQETMASLVALED